MALNLEFTLTVNTLFEFLDATPSSRCIYEGQAVLNAGHIILYGITEKTESQVNVFALCLKSSGLKDIPHELKAIFLMNNDKNISIKSLICSCKAGNSSRCKHVAALLFLCTRL